MPCNYNCCEDTTQLCVDAQFFVPECDIDLCYATRLVFDGANTGLRVSGLSQLIDTAVGDHEVEFDLVVGTTPLIVGKLKLEYEITADPSNSANRILAWKSGPGSVSGINVVPPVSDSAWITLSTSTSGCQVNMVNFANLLSSVRGTTTFSPLSNTTDIIEVKYAGQGVYQIRLTVPLAPFSSTPSGPAFSTFLQLSSDYDMNWANQNFPPSAPGLLSQALVETSLSGSAPIPACQAQNIAEADLILQLRANKNVLKAGENNESNVEYKSGKYDVCISYKPCELGSWENKHVFRIEKTDSVVIAKWGSDTNKNGAVILENDCALLRDDKGNFGIKLTSCGLVQNVYDNKNDFALHIENVMQSFSLVGQDGLVVPNGTILGPKPYEPYQVQLSSNKFVRAKLANSKLYISLKFICLVNIPDSEPITEEPHNCCPGTLNPFTPNTTVINGITYTQVKGFLTEEITHMQDHPLHGSKLSREGTICFTDECVRSAGECPE
jgi:hypothetical protein